MNNRIIVIILFLFAGMTTWGMPSDTSASAISHRLVKKDDKAKTDIIKNVLKLGQFKDLDGSVKSIAIDAINSFWTAYSAESEFRKSEEDLKLSKESLRGLQEHNVKIESAIDDLYKNKSQLNDELTELRNHITEDSTLVADRALYQNQIADLQADLLSLRNKQTGSVKDVTDIENETNRIINSEDYGRLARLRDELMNDIAADVESIFDYVTSAKTNSLLSFSPDTFVQIKDKYNTLHPALVIIDRHEDEVIAANLDTLAVYALLHKGLKEIEQYLDGQFDDKLRVPLFMDFNSLQGGSSLGPGHKQECVTYLYALKNQYYFKEEVYTRLFSPLYKQKGINEDEKDKWLKIIDDIKNEIDNDDDKKSSWSLCHSIMRALSNLESFINNYQIADIKDYRKGLSDIWKLVDKTSLR